MSIYVSLRRLWKQFRSRFGLVAAVGLLAIVAAGCSPLSPVGMMQRDDGSTLFSLGCENPNVGSFTVDAIQTSDSDTSGVNTTPLWKIHAVDTGGAPLESVLLGEVPPGFDEVLAYEATDWFEIEVNYTLVFTNEDGSLSERGPFGAWFDADQGLDGWATDRSSSDMSDDEYWRFVNSTAVDGWGCGHRLGLPVAQVMSWVVRVALAAALLVPLVLLARFVTRRRRRSRPTGTCNNCWTPMLDDDESCPQCGEPRLTEPSNDA
jgi:hypothetical protein